MRAGRRLTGGRQVWAGPGLYSTSIHNLASLRGVSNASVRCDRGGLGTAGGFGHGRSRVGGGIPAGDLIVTDFVNGTLDAVDPTTGAVTVIATGFSNPKGVAVNAQGMIFVSDIITQTIDEVNPTTGVVTTFSGNGVGTGPAVTRPFEMTFVGNTLYVADGGVASGTDSAVYTVDASGNRTLVAGGSNSLFGIGGAAGLALGSSGGIYASANSPSTIFSVTTGNATPLTTTIPHPEGLSIGNGQLFAVSAGGTNPSVWSINSTTGVATDIADNNGIGTGPAFQNLAGVVYDPNNGMLYVTDLGTSSNPQIDEVNPLTGDRMVISGNGVGGTTFGQLSLGIAVYPSIASVPEPSSLALLAAGAVGLVVYTRRRGLRRDAQVPQG